MTWTKQEHYRSVHGKQPSRAGSQPTAAAPSALLPLSPSRPVPVPLPFLPFPLSPASRAQTSASTYTTSITIIAKPRAHLAHRPHCRQSARASSRNPTSAARIAQAKPSDKLPLPALVPVPVPTTNLPSICIKLRPGLVLRGEPEPTPSVAILFLLCSRHHPRHRHRHLAPATPEHAVPPSTLRRRQPACVAVPLLHPPAHHLHLRIPTSRVRITAIAVA
jgi:hypothetical protein